MGKKKKATTGAAFQSFNAMKNYNSTIAAFGAFFLTEEIPFSIAELLEYIWLVPITCPLVDFKLNLGFPFDAVVRSKQLSLEQFF